MKNLIIVIITILLTSISLYSACGYTVVINQLSDGQYSGDARAKATITLNGGSSHYAFFWDGIPKNNDTSDFMKGGTHTFIIYDSVANCFDSTSFSLIDTGNCPEVKVTITEKDECDYNDLSLIVNAYNIHYPYYFTYLWSTGSTSETTDKGLISGLYTVSVFIRNSPCVYTKSKQVYDDTCERCAMFEIDLQEKDSIGRNDIKIFSELNTGVFNPSGNYKYKWNTGDTTKNILYKSSGSYRLTVTDLTYGCVTDTVIDVIDDTNNLCIYNAKIFKYNDSCGLNDVTLVSSESSGIGPYLFTWSSGDVGRYIRNKTSGNYTVYIKDSITGCIYDTTLVVVDEVCDTCSYFTPSLSYSDTCQLNDVKIFVKLKDSISSYTYIWNTGDSSQNLIGKGAGKYYVTITSSNGCIYKDSILVVDSTFNCCRASFITTDSIQYQSFQATSTSNVIAYGWSFGDNTTGVGQSVNHTYNLAGSYNVCHFIETITGCKDTSCNTILIPTQGKNLKIIHYGSPYVFDTFKLTQIFYKNIGTTTEYPTIEYSYPIGCSFNNSDQTPATNIGNKLTYNIGQLAPGQKGHINIMLNVPNTYTLGSLKGDTSKILTLINDIDPLNNIIVRQDSVVGSWDPNEKLANPQGLGADGHVPMNTKEINYLIHFQNEGNYRTFRVRVEDEIDPSLDMSSLIFGDVSHPARMVINGSKVVWYFDNIELTPKSQNEEKSKGYISYSIKLKKGLPEGTKIQNTAYIYFDKNPAIITNTTVHTLKVDAQTNGIQSFNLGKNQIQIKRNQHDLSLASELTIDQVEVFSMSGQKVIEKSIKAKKADFEISSWPSGIYIFHVKVKDEVHQLKIKL